MEFSERLAKLLKEKHLNANELSKVIEVQRSTLSHLLSGRNKPSLDLIERFYTAFPDVNLTWLVTGKGSMYTPVNPTPYIADSNPVEVNPSPKSGSNLFEVEEQLNSGVATTLTSQPSPDSSQNTDTAATHANQVAPTTNPEPPTSEQSTRQRIAIRSIIYFDDGSFEIYNNSQM